MDIGLVGQEPVKLESGGRNERNDSDHKLGFGIGKLVTRNGLGFDRQNGLLQVRSIMRTEKKTDLKMAIVISRSSNEKVHLKPVHLTFSKRLSFRSS